MANNVITTSFTITFGSGGGGGAVLKAEVDDRTDGLNGGNTNFMPGDKVGWLLFKTTQGSNAVTVTGKKSSLGSIVPAGTGTGSKEVKEFLQFANEATASLGYPCPGNIKSMTWVGTSYGEVVKVDETTVKISKFEGKPDNPVAGVLEIVYDSPCETYYLENTLLEGRSTYDALIVIVGNSPE